MNTRSKIFLLVAAVLLLATGAFAQHEHDAHGTAAATAQPAAKKVTDPVCGMEIDPATAAAKSVYAGKTYYFCSKDEKALFDKNPEKYVKKD